MKSTRFLSRAIAAAALLGSAASARAQVAVHAPKNPSVKIESGEVATIAFTVINQNADTTTAEPVVTLPAKWNIVMSPAATVLAPAQREVWLLSVRSPSTAAAGNYTIRVNARRPRVAAGGPNAEDVTAPDSVVVTIAERHGVAVRSLTSLSYIMSGEAYESRFIVQNLGNVAARFDISAKSTQGAEPRLSHQVVALAPGQLDTVVAAVTIPKTISTTAEETLLLSVVDVAMDSVRNDASVQATVVPSASNGPSMWTVPAQFAIRSAAPGTGVSAFTATGFGKLTQTSDVMVDFDVRGPTGKGASFGEQETYRLGLSNKRGSVRIGDYSYGFSQLITTGARGTGAEVKSNFNGFVGGAYVERDRSSTNSPVEASAMIGTDPIKKMGGSLVGLTRGGAAIVSSSARAELGGARMGVELAASDSQQTTGKAGRVSLTGAAPIFSYDLAAQHSSAGFASVQQGTSDMRASVVGQEIGTVILTASANMHDAQPTVHNAGFAQRTFNSIFGANLRNGISIEGEHFARADKGGLGMTNGAQESLRLRGRHVFGAFDASLNFQSGTVAQRDSAGRQQLSMGTSVTTHFGDGQFVTLFGDYGNGQGLGEGGRSTLSAGGNTELHFSATTLRLMSYVSTAAGRWSTNSDIAIERAMPRVTVALRARNSVQSIGGSSNSLFLELKTPFGIPTAPINEVGRARVEVIDAETGRGVSGSLVRLGGQAAVTDAQGYATFRDLKPGNYRTLVDGAAVAGRVVASGADVAISKTSRKPTEVRVSLSRGSHVLARVRSFERPSAIASGDTLTEVGAVGQVVIALVTPTDTLWQTTDERGRADFGTVAPGHYVVAIPRYDAPNHTHLEKTEFELNVGASETRQIEFKLIPQIRAVEFQGEATIIAAPAAPAKAGPLSNVITGKPITAPPAPITQQPSRGQRQQNQQNPQRQQDHQQQDQQF